MRPGSTHGITCAGSAAVKNATAAVLSKPQELRQFFHAIDHIQDPAVLFFQHAFLNAVVQKLKQFVIEARDIEEQDGLGMDPQRLPRQYFEQLLKRSESARQCNK